MSGPPIEIEFTPTREDAVAVRVRAARGYESPQMRRIARQKAVIGALVGVPIGAFAVLGAVVIGVLISRGVTPRPGLWGAIAIFGVIWATQILRAATRDPWKGASGRRLERLIRRTTDSSELTSSLFRIDREGVTHENEGVVLFVPWGVMERVDYVGGAWYFHAGKHAMMRVPERVVPDAEALRVLIAEQVPQGDA